MTCKRQVATHVRSLPFAVPSFEVLDVEDAEVLLHKTLNPRLLNAASNLGRTRWQRAVKRFSCPELLH